MQVVQLERRRVENKVNSTIRQQFHRNIYERSLRVISLISSLKTISLTSREGCGVTSYSVCKPAR